MHGGTDAFVRRSSSCASQTQDRESGSRVVWSHPSCRSPGSADLSQLLTQRALTTEAAGARVCDSGTCLGECLRPSAFPCDPSFLRCVRSGHAAPRADEDFLQSTSLRSRPERRTRPRASFRAAHTTYFGLRCPAGLGASRRVMGSLCSRGTADSGFGGDRAHSTQQTGRRPPRALSKPSRLHNTPTSTSRRLGGAAARIGSPCLSGSFAPLSTSWCRSRRRRSEPRPRRLDEALTAMDASIVIDRVLHATCCLCMQLNLRLIVCGKGLACGAVRRTDVCVCVWRARARRSRACVHQCPVLNASSRVCAGRAASQSCS
jgi:hypothetical protein